MSTKVRRVFLRPPTIRTLVVFWAAGVLFVWAILVGGWFTAKSQLTRIEGHVANDISALDATHRLEAAILAYQHDELLWHASKQTQSQQHPKEYLATAQQIADDFGPYVSTPTEQALLTAIQKDLRILAEQSPVIAPTPTKVETGSALDLLTLVRDLQIENEDQMKASVRAADRVHNEVSKWAIGLSGSTALLLFAGAWSLMRRIIRPAWSLTRAAEAFGQGDFSPRVPILHDDELGALARTFNNMAGDIADREKNRLEFVAMVVHDLKNPVLAIEMAARL
jgi:HAMP domain-containing protein